MMFSSSGTVLLVRSNGTSTGTVVPVLQPAAVQVLVLVPVLVLVRVLNYDIFGLK
jgi:hypothetical protein